MPWKNPTRPNESPLRVETNGEWNAQTAYQQQEEDQRQRNLHRQRDPFNSIRGGTVVHDNFKDYQHSHTKEGISDRALEAAVERDLRQRNLKHKK